jgi:iron complex transport system substrate-binding protein
MVAWCALAAAGCAPSDGPPPETTGAAEAADTARPTSSPSRPSANAPSVVDDGGRTVSLAAPPRRIVSLIPAVTEMLIALGAGDRLVARTDYDTNPLLDTLPSVGGGLTPDIEWLVRRRPDLVIGWTDGTARTVLGRLRELGIGVYSADIQSLRDADDTVARMGVLLGLEDEAGALIARTRRGLEDVRAAVRDMPRPRVLYVLSVDPPMTAGPARTWWRSPAS